MGCNPMLDEQRRGVAKIRAFGIHRQAVVQRGIHCTGFTLHAQLASRPLPSAVGILFVDSGRLIETV
jgi:hypothetical protein